jgi:hypothetical protein
MTRLPRFANRAWPAKVGISALDRCATFSAVLRLAFLRTQLSPVYHFVAINTKRDAVADVGCKFWMFCEWLYVMSVQCATAFAAMLACVVITLVYRFAPCRQRAALLRTFARQRTAILPAWGILTNQVNRAPFVGALFAAKRGAFISAVERLAALLTKAGLWWVAMRPTLFGAIVRSIRTICFYLKFTPTLAAFLGDLSVAHCITLSPEYVAMIRNTPTLIES